jgi:hypothetical protein
LQGDVRECSLDLNREGAAGWGYLKYWSNRVCQHEYSWSSLASSQAGCADRITGCGACLQVFSGHGGKDWLTHLLLLRFVHILEINNMPAPIATTFGANLYQLSAKLLVLLPARLIHAKSMPLGQTIFLSFIQG